jgi:putative ABC transport system ATP-binding protein
MTNTATTMAQTRGTKPGTRDNGSLIRVRDLTRVYRQGEVEVHALRGADLDILEGEFTALAGPSGSGKTTLLNIIGALDVPTAGSVQVAGRDIVGLSKGAPPISASTRWASSSRRTTWCRCSPPTRTPSSRCSCAGSPAAERRAIVEPLLERVGLADMMHRKPHELSGGQQQRAAIVRALATHPRIVLADEPTANLDSETSAGLLDLMLELNRELGTTFLFSTHDPAVIERARRLVELLDGRVHRDSAAPA